MIFIHFRKTKDDFKIILDGQPYSYAYNPESLFVVIQNIPGNHQICLSNLDTYLMLDDSAFHRCHYCDKVKYSTRYRREHVAELCDACDSQENE